MSETTLTRVRYAGLDFDTLEDELRARLQVKFASSFNDFSVSSLGIVLLDVVSFGLDTLSFYLDRRATDTYLSTARTRRSVALLTRQLGYKMSGGVAASVDLNVAPKIQYNFPVTITKGFQFKGPGSIVYEAAQAVTFAANSTDTISVPCYQGQTITETFTSSGSGNQVFKLARVPSGSFIAQGTVTVLVNGNPFTENEFLTFDATDQFELGYNDDPPTIRFGDGVAGNIPAQNASIVVTYVATMGSAGRVISAAISKPVAPLVVVGQNVDLVINNPFSSVGGDDLESLDHAKTFAPKVFKARRVAITRSDYEALAGAFVDPLFGRVAAAQAICARSASQDVELLNQTGTIRSNTLAVSNEVTAAMSTATTGAKDLATTIATSLADIQSNITLLVTKVNAASANLTSILASSRTAKSNVIEIQSDYTDAHVSMVTTKSNVSSLRNSISALTVAGTSQLTSSDQTSFLTTIDTVTAALNQIDALLTLMNTLAGTANSNAESITSQAQLAQVTLSSDIGLNTTTDGSILLDLNTSTTNAVTAVGVSGAVPTALFAQIQAALTAASSRYTQITDATTAIEEHVDSILAEDCQANLVTVPILARDTSGYYAAPSNGLIRSVQSYLDGIKEVTQTVKVTSGANFLVPAVLRVRIGVKLGVSEQVIASTANSVIDGVLRNKVFGDSLYVSDLLNPLKALTGVAFVNVTITGYRPVGGSILTDKLDSDGNLIVDATDVVTLSVSDLSITTEVYTTS